MLLETLTQAFRLARSVNATNSSYPSIVPTTTNPFTANPPTGDAGTATGSSVINLGREGALVQNAVIIVPFGTGADNDTMNMRVLGWRKVPGPTVNATTQTLYLPVNLGEFLCTFGNVSGVANSPVVAANFFCDTIAVTVGSTLGGEAASENIISPGNDTIASLLLDLKGFEYLQLVFNVNSSATDCNALVALL